MRNRRLRCRGDRGAVLIIVAVFAVVSVLMLAAVIDLGNQRSEVKQVTLSTDAAALAAVSVIDFTDPEATGSGIDCSDVASTDTRWSVVQDVADHYLSGNGGSAGTGCEITFDPLRPRTAFVTVTASDAVDYRFASGGGSVNGSSSNTVQLDAEDGGDW